MQNKIKFYSDNEKSLLESVKSTILKTYDKSQKFEEKNEKKISELEQVIVDLRIQLKSKEKELQSTKNMYETKISNINNMKILKEKYFNII